MASPLDGVKVLDLCRVLAGPHAGRVLADLGADVVKVEPPEGDVSRHFGKKPESAYFRQQNAGKRSITVDLREPEGRDLVRRLAAVADVVTENFRPGEMSMADTVTGLHGVIGVLAALRLRDATGLGQHVDLAMIDAMAASDDMLPN